MSNLQLWKGKRSRLGDLPMDNNSTITCQSSQDPHMFKAHSPPSGNSPTQVGKVKHKVAKRRAQD